jgi:ABC-type glucose/galactose transport system permease subunit
VFDCWEAREHYSVDIAGGSGTFGHVLEGALRLGLQRAVCYSPRLWPLMGIPAAVQLQWVLWLRPLVGDVEVRIGGLGEAMATSETVVVRSSKDVFGPWTPEGGMKLPPLPQINAACRTAKA